MLSQQKVIRIGIINNYKSVMLGSHLNRNMVVGQLNTDGMMNGVPYIMYDAGYYHELYEQGDFFEDDHDALMLLNTYLDDPEYRNEVMIKHWIGLVTDLCIKMK